MAKLDTTSAKPGAGGEQLSATDLIAYLRTVKQKYGKPIRAITVRPDIHEMLRTKLEQMRSEEVTIVTRFYGVGVYVVTKQLAPIKIGRPQ